MPKRVLFLCVKNSSRSQMAEALLRMAGVDLEVHSAGIRPAEEVNPNAVKVMHEIDRKVRELLADRIARAFT